MSNALLSADDNTRLSWDDVTECVDGAVRSHVLRTELGSDLRASAISALRYMRSFIDRYVLQDGWAAPTKVSVVNSPVFGVMMDSVVDDHPVSSVVVTDRGVFFICDQVVAKIL